MILLIGKQGSGKTTLARGLVRSGFRQVIEYTTRPMRTGEKDGEDYHFISNEEFERKVSEGFFAQHTVFNTKFGQVYYGTARTDAMAGNNTIMVTNPSGAKQLKEKGFPVQIAEVVTPDDIRYTRLRKRGDMEDEIQRRFDADSKDFSSLEALRDVFLSGEAPVAANVTRLKRL